MQPLSPGLHLAGGASTGAAVSPCLLLIEADEAVAAALLRALRRHGWATRWAATAAAGLKLQARWAPHVVLLASDLPDMATETLVAHLSAQGGCGILVLTGHEDHDLMRAVLARGAHDVMSKPVRIGDVAARLQAVQCRFGQLGATPDRLP